VRNFSNKETHGSEELHSNLKRGTHASDTSHVKAASVGEKFDSISC
jgi:hypothetical protein